MRMRLPVPASAQASVPPPAPLPMMMTSQWFDMNALLVDRSDEEGDRGAAGRGTHPCGWVPRPRPRGWVAAMLQLLADCAGEIVTRITSETFGHVKPSCTFITGLDSDGPVLGAA